MHVALSYNEILLEILQYLDCPGFTRNLCFRNPYLPACARVSKTMSVPALDLLWRDLGSVMPLLKILSSFHWDDGAQYYRHLDGLPVGDVERFKQYACRVRTFHCEHPDRWIHPDMTLDVFRWSGQRYMLPELQSLMWKQRSPSDTTVMSFVVPSLQTLYFSLNFDINASNVSPPISIAISTLLANVLAAPTSLQELCLNLTTLDFPISPPPLMHVQRLRKVTLYLRWPTLAVHFLRPLSRLETLTELTVRTYGSDWDHGIADIGEFDGENSFLRLQYLSLCGPFAHLSFILSVTSSPSIDFLALDVEASDGNSPDDCYAFLTTLHTKTAMWSTTLRVASFQFGFEPNHGPWPQSQEYIQPLLVCNALRHVRIELPFDVLSITDEDAATFAHAWPVLVNMELVGNFNHVPSFSAVADMIRRMPQLSMLTMPWLIDDAGILALQGLTEPISGQLKTLDVACAWLNFSMPQAGLFGEVLERLFPRLTFEGLSGGDPETRQKLMRVRLALDRARRNNRRAIDV
ncbi:hypothetical protein B0H21DRAFT_195839 [Amylocystis lapponica]|nr:hypothetical protein B0H21DRAFT_195839 [Amylocystis lapponica]